MNQEVQGGPSEVIYLCLVLKNDEEAAKQGMRNGGREG